MKTTFDFDTPELHAKILVVANTLKAWYLEADDLKQYCYVLLMEESDIIVADWGGDYVAWASYRLPNLVRDYKRKLRRDAMGKSHVTYEWYVQQNEASVDSESVPEYNEYTRTETIKGEIDDES